MASPPIIEVTALAAEKLGEILKEQGEGEALLRMMVVPGPNGGFQYMLGLEKEPKEDDIIIETNTVQVLVDQESAPLVEGAQIDYIDGLMRSGFVISNPNFQGGGGGCGGGGGGCGCGGGGGGCGCGGGAAPVQEASVGACGCGGGGCGGGGEAAPVQEASVGACACGGGGCGGGGGAAPVQEASVGACACGGSGCGGHAAPAPEASVAGGCACGGSGCGDAGCGGHH